METLADALPKEIARGRSAIHRRYTRNPAERHHSGYEYGHFYFYVDAIKSDIQTAWLRKKNV